MRAIEFEKKAIERIKAFEPEDGYYVGYSGGKDSDCLKILCALAGVKHDLVHNHTTLDAPETVYYIRSQPDVQIQYPEITAWDLIVKKLMPPTRLVRYCCEVLKERGGQGRLVMTGVRWSESVNRAELQSTVSIIGKPKGTQKLAEDIGVDYRVNWRGGIILNDDNDTSRRMVELCYRTRKTMLNPIVDWSDQQVWDFLHYYGCRSNPLYEIGFCRIGCIGCPMASKSRYTEFRIYPKYKLNYIRAFDRMIAARKERGLPTAWNSGEECFKWWMEESIDQISIEDYLEMEDAL